LSLYNSIYNRSPVFVQNLIVSAYGYQWKKRRFGGIFPQEYEAAKERENFTGEQWQRYRQQALQKILLHAFDQVPFYQNSFKQQGLSRQFLANIAPDTIQQLPVLLKDDLRKEGTSTLLSANKEKGGSFFSSSGSTGTPVKILYSPAMHQRWFALFESRIRNWAGVSSNVPRGMIGGRRILPGAEAQPPFYRYNAAEKQVYFSAYHINKTNAVNYLKGILEHQVSYMTGYAMSNFFLARFFKELQLQPPQLKAVLPSSEKLTPEMRKLFKEVYGCKTFDSWGSVEACGMISECEHRSLHINPDAGLIEVLDEHLQPVPSGTAGDVYCTGFLNFDQPLIRYKIGDRMILSDKSCSCGRNMPVVEDICGRIEDVVIGKDGREMVRFHSVFYDIDKIKQAQVIQETTFDILIKIVTENSLTNKELADIKDRITTQLGDVDVAIEEVDSIPLNNNGKFQAVISKIKRGQQQIIHHK